MRSNVHSSPDDIDITSLWSVLKNSGGKILGTSAAIGLLTFLGLSLVPPKYASEAQMRIAINDPIRSEKLPNASSSNESVTTRLDKEAIASRVQELRSPDLARKLIAELKFNTRAEFNSEHGGQGLAGGLLRLVGLSGPRAGETEEERILKAYFKALQVVQVKETRVINVEFSSTDSDLAATAANRIVELYQEWLGSQGVGVTKGAEDWLKPEVEKRAKELSLAEAVMERARSQMGRIGTGTQQTGINDQQLAELSTEVTRARSARSEAEARARSARDLMARGSPDAISDVQRSPVIQGLIAQRVRAEREKAEADTTLLAGHPRMKQLNANVTDLKRQIAKEALTIVDGLEKEAKGLLLREELASKNLDDLKKSVGNRAGDFAQLGALEDDVKAKRRELEALRERYEASKSRGDVKSQPIEAQLITTARPSSTPSSPKKIPLSLLASAASLILGFVFVITRELLSGARRQGGGSRPVEAPVFSATPAAAAPIAARTAASPLARAAPAAAAAAVASVPPAAAAAVSEDVTLTADSIGDRILASGGQQGGYRTVVTGEADGIDVREEAAEIAGALTARGKQVVLVDWAFDGVGISQALGLDPAPGFIDLLNGNASFEDVIRRLPDGDAHVLTCGSAHAGGASIFDPDRINLVLDALDEAYDHIVVTGDHQAIRDLFLAIQGRFDAGVEVGDGRRVTRAPGTFLGFQVTDIDVMRLDRSGQARASRKMQLTRGTRPSPELHA